jgi:hypothetical protein
VAQCAAEPATYGFTTQVDVFPSLVKRQSKDWPESKQRTARWFSAAEAAALVDNDQLYNLIQKFETRKASRH